MTSTTSIIGIKQEKEGENICLLWDVLCFLNPGISCSDIYGNKLKSSNWEKYNKSDIIQNYLEYLLHCWKWLEDEFLFPKNINY